jgi:hypothetical protein
MREQKNPKAVNEQGNADQEIQNCGALRGAKRRGNLNTKLA